MKCPSEIELNEFAEDRLESRRRWEIQEHLEECERCSADLEGLDWITGCLGVIDTADEAASAQHPADADLAALAGGRVAPDLKAELLSHLSICAECARVFGTLPRKAKGLTIRPSFYRFAAAAVLVVAIAVAAFTGPFANLGQSARTMVATELDRGKSDSERETPQSREAVPTPAPTVVAEQPTPEPAAASAVSKSGQAAIVAQTTAMGPARVARQSGFSRRVRPDNLNNMRIAMAEHNPLPKTVADMPVAAEPAIASEGGRFDATKSAPPVAVPSPAKPFATMVMGGSGMSGASATRAPAPGAPAGVAAPTQRAQTKSQMIQQSPQPQTASKKKAAAKSAAKAQGPDETKPKQELRKTGVSADNSGKSVIKSLVDGDAAGGNGSTDSGHSNHSRNIAGHAPTDAGQSPPGSHDA